MNKHDKIAVWGGPLVVVVILACLGISDFSHPGWDNPELAVAVLMLIFGLPVLYLILVGFMAVNIRLLTKKKKTQFGSCIVTGVTEGIIVAMILNCGMFFLIKSGGYKYPPLFFSFFVSICPYTIGFSCLMMLVWWSVRLAKGSNPNQRVDLTR